MPLPFEQFQGKGVLGFLDSSSSSPEYKIWANPEKLHGRVVVEEDLCFVVNNGFFSDPPPAKRLNSGQPGSQHHQQWVFPFSDPGHESHDSFLTPPKIAVGDENDQEQTTLIIFSAAAELAGTTTIGGDNNPILTQGILARLSHNLNNDDTKTFLAASTKTNHGEVNTSDFKDGVSCQVSKPLFVTFETTQQHGLKEDFLYFSEEESAPKNRRIMKWRRWWRLSRQHM